MSLFVLSADNYSVNIMCLGCSLVSSLSLRFYRLCKNVLLPLLLGFTACRGVYCTVFSVKEQTHDETVPKSISLPTSEKVHSCIWKQ